MTRKITVTLELTTDQAKFLENLVEQYLFLTRKMATNPQRQFAVRIANKLAEYHIIPAKN